MIRIPVAALALSFAAAIAPAAWGQSTGTTSASEPKSAPGAPLKGLDVAAEPRQLRIATKAWTGDFDKMLERRMIRIYAPFSRSLYHNDKGRERGIAVELARDWERYLNVKYAKQLGKRPLTVYIAPATRDKLLPYLNEGLADVSIGNLTVTDERQKLVDFVPGDEGRRTISEVVVTGPASPELKTLDDLSGKKVHVRRASSYYESLAALNERLGREGRPPAELVLVPESLEDEDMMDMLNAGLLAIHRRRRLEGEDVGAGSAQGQAAQRPRAARGREDRLGGSQGQPEAQGGDRRLLPELGAEERGRRLPDGAAT